MSLLESVPPPPLGDPGKTFPPLFSMPPPGPPPGLPPPVSAEPESQQPNLNQAKLARQEQLVKKLSGMLMGTDEELIKSCIAELRAKHGKLSGENNRQTSVTDTDQLLQAGLRVRSPPILWI